MSRGFAGGLAEGLNQGMQMYALSESIQARKKAEARADAGEARAQEDHDIKMQQHASNRKLSETMASVLGWTPQMAGGPPTNPDAPSMGAPAQPPETPSAIKVAGPIPQGGLAMNAPSTMAPYAPDNPAGALTPQQAPQARQAEPISADKFIQKQILTGNAFGNPQVLNKLAAASFEAGQGEKALAFLNMAHQAHEKGLTQAMSKLMEGDGKGAADIIRSRGTDLEGDLTPVEGKEHVWKGIVDGKEREFDVRKMAGAANPMEWFTQLDQKNQRDAELLLKQKEDARQTEDQANKTKESASKLKTDETQRTLNIALAGKAKRSPVGAKVSTKGIERANAERHKQFDLYATEKDIDTGKQQVNTEKRQAINRAVHTQEGVLRKTLGRDLEPDEIREVTDAMLDYPHGGTKEEIKAWQKGFLDRFDIDGAEDGDKPAAVTVADADKMGEGKPPPEEAPAPLAKEPTQEEKELEALKSHRDYPTLINDLKKLQKERYASNLNDKQKAEVEAKIKAILDSDKPKGSLKSAARNRSPSSDPEVAPAGYGKRRDGTDKGTGWLGVHKTKSGNDMTEYTVGLNINGKDVDVPTLVPGLTDKELAYLKTEPSLKERTPMNESILRKAAEHAKKRLSEGKSVFAN